MADAADMDVVDAADAADAADVADAADAADVADALNLDAHGESYNRMMGGALKDFLVRTAAPKGVQVSNVTLSFPRKTPIDTQRDRETYAITVHADVNFPNPRCVCVCCAWNNTVMA